MTLAAGPLLPVWLVLVLTVCAMLVVATHVLTMHRTAMPASRRRIRTANGVVMLILAPTLAQAVCFSHPSQTRAFVFTWWLVIALLGLVLLLAGLDITNNLRLYGRERARLRRQAAADLAANLAGRQQGNTGDGGRVHA